MIRINPTLGFTLILLSMMIGAGVVSGSWGYTLGREALRGVTQPETRPGQLGASDGESAPQSGLVLLSEDQLINNARARMEGNTPRAAVTPPSTPAATPTTAIAPSAPEPEGVPNDWSENPPEAPVTAPWEEETADGLDEVTDPAVDNDEEVESLIEPSL
jgi:hypothetical protein